MVELLVNMGEIEIGHEGDILTSLGLGSCVGVAIYDPVHKVAGLAHIMLPESREVQRESPERKVIIADKDLMTRNNLKRILASHGFEVTSETQEKDETINSYQRYKPQVTLISAFLPPTNAVDVLHSMLNIDKKANAIILSPNIDRNTFNYYMTNGAKEVLINPFTESNVISGIEYVLYNPLLKFADKAIPIMIGRMVNRGASRTNLVAKIAGGAHMFPSIINEEELNIGRKNTEAIKKILAASGIKLLSEDTGKNCGRTVMFDVSTGKMQIRTIQGTNQI